MTVPHDRVSYGSHAFPFSGLHAIGAAHPPLPLLPIRIRGERGSWSRPLSAVLDTGSTRTILPYEVAAAFGFEPSAEVLSVRVLGADAETRPADFHLAIVDAHFPDVTCWEVAGVKALVPVKPAALEFPLLGWDLLGLFDIRLNAEKERIDLRLERSGKPPPTA